MSYMDLGAYLRVPSILKVGRPCIASIELTIFLQMALLAPDIKLSDQTRDNVFHLPIDKLHSFIG